MRWDGKLGIWYLVDGRNFAIHGTTFRNAGYLTLQIDLFNYGLDFYLGKHIGTHLWLSEKIKTLEWKSKDCNCYGCALHQPLSPELKAILLKKYFEGNL